MTKDSIKLWKEMKSALLVRGTGITSCVPSSVSCAILGTVNTEALFRESSKTSFFSSALGGRH